MKRLSLLIPLLCLGWVNPGPSSPPGRPWIGNDLDAVIQDRFGHITEEDIQEGRLGVSRVALPDPKHLARRFRAENVREAGILAGLESEGWTASMYVLGRDGAFTGPILTSRAGLPVAPDAAKLRNLAGRALKAGKGLQDAWGPYTLEARPIPVSGPSCAGCHDPSLKEGDPLGAVVYLYHRAAAP
jgi:hypothetical protein